MPPPSLGSPEVLLHATHPVGRYDDASQIELVDRGDSDVAETSTLPKQPPAFMINPPIRWIHFVLGCSVLMSWNVVITAMPFFLSRLTNSPLRSTFAFYLTAVFNATNSVFLVHATLNVKHTRPSHQTRSSIAWLVVLNFLLTLSTFFTPSQSVFFAFILFNATAQSVVGTYLQTSVTAVASLFGPLALQAMMSGQAAVAVAISGVQLISAAASVRGSADSYVSDGSAEERTAFIFFALATLFLIASAMAHRWMIGTPVYQKVVWSLERGRKSTPSLIGREEEQEGLVSGDTEFVALTDTENALRVAKANITYEVALTYTLVVSLAVYPPITLSILSTNPAIHPLLFSALHFFVFNVADFLGRYVCSFSVFLIWNARRLLIISAARTLFIPLFLICNIQLGTTTTDRSPVINSDLVFMLILFFFGWSNGYLSSMIMMAVPSLEHNPRLKGRKEDVDVAATVASLCLVAGLPLGSLASFAVKAPFCNCNPFTT